MAQWDLQIDQTSTVNAVRIGADEKDPEFTQTLANLRTRIETAAASDAFAGKRIANINGLKDHYVEIGAYDDITPADYDTTIFTPAQPPLALTCASGTAVTGPEDNRPLVHDCEVLVDNEGALSGTATLNWSVDTSIDSWNGVVTGGTPTRITELDLPSNSLTGSIPAELGTLSGLTVLDLSGNQLTGEIPHEIGWLFNLTGQIGLSGNSLTGCIPVALEDVATNDFSSMSLLFCRPPPPENLAAGAAAETNIPLTWDSVSNTSKYRVEYRLDRVGDWAVHDETITLASHAADSLNCETAYQFRVSAYGSGTNYAQDWSEPSLPVSEATTECTSPVFDPSSYTFALAEGAAVDDVVGTVTARHPGGGSLTYSITAGNDDGNFNIDGTSGEITAAAAIGAATPSLTTLTIEAAATGIQSATATVEIYIARTPNGFSVAPSGGHEFTISWNSVDHADEYTVQSREPGGDWVSLVTTSTGITISNLLCDRTHQFQVAARVQGVMSPYTDPVVEASCNVPPTFGSDSYSFPVLEDAAIRDVVGQVSATDTEAESLTYSITGGNEAGHFSIDSATGEIRVAGALDYDVISEYNLTVGATDGNKGVVAVTVQVLIEALLEPSAACRNGVTVLAPDSNTGLVEDCVVLLTHRDTLGGAAALNWSQNVVIATWDGVSLSSPSNRVGGLFLADLGLTGTIPAGLGDLDGLTRLELDGNQLTGTIPAALGNLGNLRYLYLDNNRLTGQIPSQIGNLAELRVLYLGNNQLEGPLPQGNRILEKGKGLIESKSGEACDGVGGDDGQ